jgi:CubicO group peptidase (beta-lactamase class C family)
VSRSGGTPVGELTMFSLQSISKTFTAFAVLAAVRDGLLDLDAPVSWYLPDFTVRSRSGDRPQELT